MYFGMSLAQPLGAGLYHAGMNSLVTTFHVPMGVTKACIAVATGYCLMTLNPSYNRNVFVERFTVMVLPSVLAVTFGLTSLSGSATEDWPAWTAAIRLDRASAEGTVRPVLARCMTSVSPSSEMLA